MGKLEALVCQPQYMAIIYLEFQSTLPVWKYKLLTDHKNTAEVSLKTLQRMAEERNCLRWQDIEKVWCCKEIWVSGFILLGEGVEKGDPMPTPSTCRGCDSLFQGSSRWALCFTPLSPTVIAMLSQCPRTGERGLTARLPGGPSQDRAGPSLEWCYGPVAWNTENNEGCECSLHQWAGLHPAVGRLLFVLELRILNLITVVEARVRDEFELAGDLHVEMNTGSSQAEVGALWNHDEMVIVSGFFTWWFKMLYQKGRSCNLFVNLSEIWGIVF